MHSSLRGQRADQTNVRDVKIEGERSAAEIVATSTVTSERGEPSKRQTGDSQDHCSQAPPFYARPDYASQVKMEIFDDPKDPMPYGYCGTFGGIRWQRSNVEDYCPCGTTSGHYLICGHTIISNEPCGANCKSKKYDVEPFKCPECEKTINDILNKLTKEEQEKVKFHFGRYDTYAFSMVFEFMAKHIPSGKNITESLMGKTVSRNVGRSCLYYGPTPGPARTLAQEFEFHHDSLEQLTRKFRNELNLHLPQASEKPKGTADKVSKKRSRSLGPLLDSDEEAVKSSKKKRMTWVEALVL